MYVLCTIIDSEVLIYERKKDVSFQSKVDHVCVHAYVQRLALKILGIQNFSPVKHTVVAYLLDLTDPYIFFFCHFKFSHDRMLVLYHFGAKFVLYFGTFEMQSNKTIYNQNDAQSL